MHPFDLSQFTDYCHLEEGASFTGWYFPKEKFLLDREPIRRTPNTADTEGGGGSMDCNFSRKFKKMFFVFFFLTEL